MHRMRKVLLPVRIKHNWFLDWSPNIQRQLKRLTFWDGSSSLRGHIETEPENLETWVAFHKGKPVAWCVLCWQNRARAEFMFYTQRKFRRRGLAKKLFRRAWEYNQRQTLVVYPWNSATQRFFESNKKPNVRINYDGM